MPRSISDKMARDETPYVLAVPELAHLDGLDALMNDPAVKDWLGGERSRDAIVKSIESERRHWQEHGFGPWVVLDAGRRTVIGRCGIRRARVRDADEVELAYAMAPAVWRRGIATSVARAAIDRGFGEARLSSIVAFALEANRASLRVLEKLGFTREGMFEHARLPHVLYRLWRPGSSS